MINDPLAGDLAEEAENNFASRLQKKAEEIKNDIAEVSEDDSDLESKLNRLKGKAF